ncbi:RNA polymerase sigma factor [Roseiconus lacunae]|uniref:RNA polymerase sigma factor n=1 Tax=Roseiconus lacunae TaxID=2605694 RepID=UPI001E44DFB0|nr:RNA polymerase sigma factor [Roseiconus lacunae]MCD0462140.1 RNA polymerase sigma factor [Roseiconus lacunae]
MYNPFTEDAAIGDPEDAQLVCQANDGDRSALEKLILRHQAWIYNIAVRMVFEPYDAEEVTQEVLIKVVTRLSTFRGDSQFRTWLYRIAVNHVLSMKRRGGEKAILTFSTYAEAINGTPDLDLPDSKSVPVEVPLLVEETKVACTTGMLLCLDRRQRLIFTLGEIFGVSDALGSEVLEMTTANFRQRLSRARRDLHQFMNQQCGLVNANNPCRCPRKTKGFIDAGHVDPNNLLFATSHLQRIGDVAQGTAREIDDIAERSFFAIYRDHPFLELAEQSRWLRRILDLPEVRATLELG